MDDVAAVLAIAQAAESADGVAPLDEATWMALRDRTADLHVVDGGFTVLRGQSLDLVVHPARRSNGLGSDLLARVERDNGTLVAWSHGNHPAAARLAARHGWQRVRDLWVMRRSLTDLPDLEVPEGVTIRSYDDADADEVVRVNAAAFAKHPEQGAMDRANLDRRMAESWFDPDGLLVAQGESPDEGGLLGFHWTKQHSDDLGEVYVVGVDPSAQGRGLGRALTLAGLHHLAGQGMRDVLLYVESDNRAAIATYERLGFEHADADTHVHYRRAT